MLEHQQRSLPKEIKTRCHRARACVETTMEVLPDVISVHTHAVLKSVVLDNGGGKYIKEPGPREFMESALPWQIFQECNSIRSSPLCVHSSQRLNWKINSNLNYWNKELQESEIKRRCSPRSALIGKSFLQGILMVLQEDCRMELMSLGKVNSLCAFFSARQPLSLSWWQSQERSQDPPARSSPWTQGCPILFCSEGKGLCAASGKSKPNNQIFTR